MWCGCRLDVPPYGGVEGGHVVGDGLDAQNRAELVVHLQGHAAHFVADAGSLDAGAEIVADLAEVAGVELLAEKGGDVLDPNGMDGGADEVIVKRCQVLLSAKGEIGGVLHLHQAPMIAGGELRSGRAELRGVAIQLLA